MCAVSSIALIFCLVFSESLSSFFVLLIKEIRVLIGCFISFDTQFKYSDFAIPFLSEIFNASFSVEVDISNFLFFILDSNHLITNCIKRRSIIIRIEPIARSLPYFSLNDFS